MVLDKQLLVSLVFTARCSAERGFANARPSVYLSVTLVYPDNIVLIFWK